MVTRQQAQSADFGPTWPEVTGFGASPNKQFCGHVRKGKIRKMRKCQYTCPACRFAPNRQAGIVILCNLNITLLVKGDYILDASSWFMLNTKEYRINIYEIY